MEDETKAGAAVTQRPEQAAPASPPALSQELKIVQAERISTGMIVRVCFNLAKNEFAILPTLFKIKDIHRNGRVVLKPVRRKNA
jgi:hypothetical protein